MKLPVLSVKKKLNGVRVFLRVDWNVPLDGSFAQEDSLKIDQGVETMKGLLSRGAIVIAATHVGRPKKREAAFSTKRLLPILASKHGMRCTFLSEPDPKLLDRAKPGSAFLLENVRFFNGEETNDALLIKKYASLADLFVNDAFASCHRAHASVVGIAKRLPASAGPSLQSEIAALERLLRKPKRPFIACIGGAKITTKLGALKAFLECADAVYVGGAMATAFFAAKKWEIGRSFIEKEGVAVAKKLLRHPRLVLPKDVLVASKIVPGARPRAADPSSLKKTEAIGDIGPDTMREWAAAVKKARTIVWNGPMGVARIPAFSHGSLVLGRAIAARSRGSAYGLVGGGDTLPLVSQTGMSEWFDHVSTGGGAMLEYVASHGRLPGLVALEKAKKASR